MDIFKTSALTFIAILTCLTLLLAPDSYRNETPLVATLPTQQDLAEISQPQTSFRSKPSQPEQIAFDEVLPVVQAKVENSITPAIESQPTDWLLILYPELARIAELENLPAYSALAELLPMLASDDPAVRLATIESLGDMTIPDALPALSAALDDPNPQVRIVALEALASQEDESVVGSIELYLYDRDIEVRVAAIEALVELESETAVLALAGLLSDPDTLIRFHGVNALGEIGGEQAISYLLQTRYDADERIRANAESILSEQDDQVAY